MYGSASTMEDTRDAYTRMVELRPSTGPRRFYMACTIYGVTYVGPIELPEGVSSRPSARVDAMLDTLVKIGVLDSSDLNTLPTIKWTSIALGLNNKPTGVVSTNYDPLMPTARQYYNEWFRSLTRAA